MSTPTTLCGVACPDHPHTCARSTQHYGHHRDVKQKGDETCSWPDPPTPRPAGPSVTDTRPAAREALRGLTGGHPTPQWRTVWTDDERLTDIGPVCEDPDHEPTDGSIYDCCPSPVIEVDDAALAAYMVALLNADREAGKDTSGQPAGESTQPEAEPTAEPEPEPATVVFTDGTVTLTRWNLVELAPDYYGTSHMQIGGWLPAGWKSGSIALGTNRLVRADLPGAGPVPTETNVTIDVKGYGGPQRFMKIQWRHSYDPTLDHRRTGGDAG